MRITPGTHTHRLAESIRAQGIEPASDVGLLMLMAGNFRLCWDADFADHCAQRASEADAWMERLNAEPMPLWCPSL